jgi:hypothetical protein
VSELVERKIGLVFKEKKGLGSEQEECVDHNQERSDEGFIPYTYITQKCYQIHNNQWISFPSREATGVCAKFLMATHPGQEGITNWTSLASGVP